MFTSKRFQSIINIKTSKGNKPNVKMPKIQTPVSSVRFSQVKSPQPQAVNSNILNSGNKRKSRNVQIRSKTVQRDS